MQAVKRDIDALYNIIDKFNATVATVLMDNERANFGFDEFREVKKEDVTKNMEGDIKRVKSAARTRAGEKLAKLKQRNLAETVNSVQTKYSLVKESGGGKSGDVVLMVSEREDPGRTCILKAFVTSPSKVPQEVVLHRRINNLLNVSYLPNMMPSIIKSGYISSENLRSFFTSNAPRAIVNGLSYPFLIMESFQDLEPLKVSTGAGADDYIFLTGTLSKVAQSLCNKFSKESRPSKEIEIFLKSVLWQLAYIVFTLNVNRVQHCDLQTNNIMLRKLDTVSEATNATNDNKWLGISYNDGTDTHLISVGIIDAGLSTEDRPCKKLRSLSSSIREDLQICHAPLRVTMAKTSEIVVGEFSRSGPGSGEVDEDFYQNILLIFDLGGLVQVEENMRKNLKALKKFLENKREPCARHRIQILSNPFEEIGQVANCTCETEQYGTRDYRNVDENTKYKIANEGVAEASDDANDNKIRDELEAAEVSRAVSLEEAKTRAQLESKASGLCSDEKYERNIETLKADAEEYRKLRMSRITMEECSQIIADVLIKPAIQIMRERNISGVNIVSDLSAAFGPTESNAAGSTGAVDRFLGDVLTKPFTIDVRDLTESLMHALTGERGLNLSEVVDKVCKIALSRINGRNEVTIDGTNYNGATIVQAIEFVRLAFAPDKKIQNMRSSLGKIFDFKPADSKKRFDDDEPILSHVEHYINETMINLRAEGSVQTTYTNSQQQRKEKSARAIEDFLSRNEALEGELERYTRINHPNTKITDNTYRFIDEQVAELMHVGLLATCPPYRMLAPIAGSSHFRRLLWTVLETHMIGNHLSLMSQFNNIKSAIEGSGIVGCLVDQGKSLVDSLISTMTTYVTTEITSEVDASIDVKDEESASSEIMGSIRRKKHEAENIATSLATLSEKVEQYSSELQKARTQAVDTLSYECGPENTLLKILEPFGFQILYEFNFQTSGIQKFKAFVERKTVFTGILRDGLTAKEISDIKVAMKGYASSASANILQEYAGSVIDGAFSSDKSPVISGFGRAFFTSLPSKLQQLILPTFIERSKPVRYAAVHTQLRDYQERLNTYVTGIQRLEEALRKRDLGFACKEVMLAMCTNVDERQKATEDHTKILRLIRFGKVFNIMKNPVVKSLLVKAKMSINQVLVGLLILGEVVYQMYRNLDKFTLYGVHIVFSMLDVLRNPKSAFNLATDSTSKALGLVQGLTASFGTWVGKLLQMVHELAKGNPYWDNVVGSKLTYPRLGPLEVHTMFKKGIDRCNIDEITVLKAGWTLSDSMLSNASVGQVYKLNKYIGEKRGVSAFERLIGFPAEMKTSEKVKFFMFVSDMFIYELLKAMDQSGSFATYGYTYQFGGGLHSYPGTIMARWLKISEARGQRSSLYETFDPESAQYLLNINITNDEPEIKLEPFPASEYEKLHGILHGLFLLYASECKLAYTATKQKLEELLVYLTTENQNMTMVEYVNDALTKENKRNDNTLAPNMYEAEIASFEKLLAGLTDDQKTMTLDTYVTKYMLPELSQVSEIFTYVGKNYDNSLKKIDWLDMKRTKLGKEASTRSKTTAVVEGVSGSIQDGLAWLQAAYDPVDYMPQEIKAQIKLHGSDCTIFRPGTKNGYAPSNMATKWMTTRPINSVENLPQTSITLQVFSDTGKANRIYNHSTGREEDRDLLEKTPRIVINFKEFVGNFMRISVDEPTQFEYVKRTLGLRNTSSFKGFVKLKSRLHELLVSNICEKATRISVAERVITDAKNQTWGAYSSLARIDPLSLKNRSLRYLFSMYSTLVTYSTVYLSLINTMIIEQKQTGVPGIDGSILKIGSIEYRIPFYPNYTQPTTKSVLGRVGAVFSSSLANIKSTYGGYVGQDRATEYVALISRKTNTDGDAPIDKNVWSEGSILATAEMISHEEDLDERDNLLPILLKNQKFVDIMHEHTRANYLFDLVARVRTLTPAIQSVSVIRPPAQMTSSTRLVDQDNRTLARDTTEHLSYLDQLIADIEAKNAPHGVFLWPQNTVALVDTSSTNIQDVFNILQPRTTDSEPQTMNLNTIKDFLGFLRRGSNQQGIDVKVAVCFGDVRARDISSQTKASEVESRINKFVKTAYPDLTLQDEVIKLTSNSFVECLRTELKLVASDAPLIDREYVPPLNRMFQSALASSESYVIKFPKARLRILLCAEKLITINALETLGSSLAEIERLMLFLNKGNSNFTSCNLPLSKERGEECVALCASTGLKCSRNRHKRKTPSTSKKDTDYQLCAAHAMMLPDGRLRKIQINYLRNYCRSIPSTPNDTKFQLKYEHEVEGDDKLDSYQALLQIFPDILPGQEIDLDKIKLNVRPWSALPGETANLPDMRKTKTLIEMCTKFAKCKLGDIQPEFDFHRNFKSDGSLKTDDESGNGALGNEFTNGLDAAKVYSDASEDRVKVPKPVLLQSLFGPNTTKVTAYMPLIVQQMCKGMDIKDLPDIASTMSLSQKNALKTEFIYFSALFLHSVASKGKFHGDPHPGNLKWDWDDSSQKGNIGILDFGDWVIFDDADREFVTELIMCFIEIVLQEGGGATSLMKQIIQNIFNGTPSNTNITPNATGGVVNTSNALRYGMSLITSLNFLYSACVWPLSNLASGYGAESTLSTYASISTTKLGVGAVLGAAEGLFTLAPKGQTVLGSVLPAVLTTGFYSIVPFIAKSGVTIAATYLPAAFMGLPLLGVTAIGVGVGVTASAGLSLYRNWDQYVKGYPSRSQVDIILGKKTKDIITQEYQLSPTDAKILDQYIPKSRSEIEGETELPIIKLVGYFVEFLRSSEILSERIPAETAIKNIAIAFDFLRKKSEMSNEEIERKLNYRCEQMFKCLNKEPDTSTGSGGRDEKTSVFLARIYIITAFRDVASKIEKGKYNDIGASIQTHAAIIVKILSPPSQKEECETLTNRLAKFGQAMLKLFNTYQVISTVVGSEVNLTWATEIVNQLMSFDFKLAAEFPVIDPTKKLYTPRSYRDWVKSRRPLVAYIQHTTSDIFDPESDVYWSNANLE